MAARTGKIGEPSPEEIKAEVIKYLDRMFAACGKAAHTGNVSLSVSWFYGRPQKVQAGWAEDVLKGECPGMML